MVCLHQRAFQAGASRWYVRAGIKTHLKEVHRKLEVVNNVKIITSFLSWAAPDDVHWHRCEPWPLSLWALSEALSYLACAPDVL